MARARSKKKPAYQPDEASAKIAAAGLASVLALGVIALLIVLGLYRWFGAETARPRATPLERAQLQPQGPQLERNPLKDRLALEAKARARIESYGWVDPQKTLARVPIERAMAMQAQKGWPDAEAAKP